MEENRSRDQMYGHGEYPGMYENATYQQSAFPNPYEGSMPPILATEEMKLRIVAEEQADVKLKTLREEADLTGDLSFVVAYKRSKALGLTKGAE